jgi:hypothetical protein
MAVKQTMSKNKTKIALYTLPSPNDIFKGNIPYK